MGIMQRKTIFRLLAFFAAISVLIAGVFLLPSTPSEHARENTDTTLVERLQVGAGFETDPDIYSWNQRVTLRVITEDETKSASTVLACSPEKSGI